MAIERTLFPDMRLFKKQVRENAIVTLREIFRPHPFYKYEDDMSTTRIHIQPTYADVQNQSKVPRLLVKIGEYSLALQDTLGGNVAGELRNALGVIAGYQRRVNVPTVISISVKAYAEEESSDIADEVATLAVYSGKHMFSQMGLIIEGATVSETREIDPSNDIYETIVMVRVTIPWEFRDVSDKDLSNPDIDIEYPDIDRKEYRAPGAYVYDMRELDVKD